MIDKDAYPGRQWLLSKFAASVKPKEQGWNFIKFFVVPPVALALLVLWCLCSLICGGGKRVTTSKVTTSSHPPKPSQKGKRDKVE